MLGLIYLNFYVIQFQIWTQTLINNLKAFFENSLKKDIFCTWNQHGVIKCYWRKIKSMFAYDVASKNQVRRLYWPIIFQIYKYQHKKEVPLYKINHNFWWRNLRRYDPSNILSTSRVYQNHLCLPPFHGNIYVLHFLSI